MRHLLLFLTRVLPIAAACFAACTTALAADAGRDLAAACATCHGGTASPSGIPTLAGMDANTLIARMKAYRSGQRAGTVMPQIAAGYSEAQIKALADYLAAQGRK